MSKAEPIPTIRALARRVGRSHTTIRRWLAHDLWPFPRLAPWPADIAAQALEWAADNLQEDRAAEPEPDPAAAVLLLEAFPEMNDARYREELNRWLTKNNAPEPDSDAARERQRAALLKQAAEAEAELKAAGRG